MVTRALIYSRVSTSDSQNPEIQAAALRDYCAAREWSVAEEIADKGFSGGTGPDKRPGLARLMVLARARKIDVIVVARLDRIFRSLKHMVNLLDELHALGVLFVSTGDQIDLSTASGKLLVHLLASFGEFERALIQERTRAALAYVRSRGQKLGRPQTRDDAAILSLRAQGMSYTQIQRLLGVSRPSIRRALIAATGTKTPENSIQKTQSFRRGENG